MSKYALLTDTHLGLSSNNENYLYLTESLFYDIYDYCIKNDIDKIIHLGDFFHFRKQTSNKTLWHAFNIANELPKNMEMYIIIGNHDTYYTTDLYPSTLQIFERYKNIHVIDKPVELDDFVLVPWGYTNFRPLPQDKILCGHFEINGFLMNDNATAYDASLNIHDFKHFKGVYSGHFHKPSENKNIRYLGAPFQHDFGDVNDDRGWYTYSDKDGLEFKKFDIAPEFKFIFYSLKDEHLTKENIFGNNVKLIFDVEISTQEMTDVVDEINAFEPQSFLVERRLKDYSILNEDSDDVTFHLKSNMELMGEYIDKAESPKHIKKTLAKNIIQNLLKENEEKE